MCCCRATHRGRPLLPRRRAAPRLTSAAAKTQLDALPATAWIGARTPAEVLDTLHTLASKYLCISVLGAARFPVRTSDWKSTRLCRDAFLHPSVPGGWEKLPRITPRELAVLRLVSVGKQTEEIAKLLGLGEETVRSHLKKVQNKLGVRNRTQAACEAIRQNLIP